MQQNDSAYAKIEIFFKAMNKIIEYFLEQIREDEDDSDNTLVALRPSQSFLRRARPQELLNSSGKQLKGGTKYLVSSTQQQNGFPSIKVASHSKSQVVYVSVTLTNQILSLSLTQP